MARRSKKTLTDIPLTGMHTSGRSYGYWGSRKVYTSQGIPGETVDLLIRSSQRDWLAADVRSVKQASPDRTAPFCKHHSICGGCNWQHLAYPSQLEWKRKFLSDAFIKYGIESPDIPFPIASPETRFFRQKLEYAFSARRWYYDEEGIVTAPAERLALGFHPEINSQKVLNIEECFLQPVPGRSICEAIKSFTLEHHYSYFDPREQCGLMRNLVIRINRRGEAMIILAFSVDDQEKIAALMAFILDTFPQVISAWYCILPADQPLWTDSELKIWGGTNPFLKEKANHLDFMLSPRSFYQPNPAQAEQIFADIRNISRLGGKELVYDLYSGIGTLGLSIADQASLVIGIEGSADATADARRNAELNGIGNCTFVHGDVLKTFTPTFIEQHGKPDLVILDPPRSGTLIEIKKTILLSAPGKIIYLSCDPLSLAYDLKMLTQDYRITYLQPYDQFPHTHHLETLVMLEKT